MDIGSVFEKVGRALADLPADLRTLAGQVTGKAERAAEMYPGWALVALPEALCAACDVPRERTEWLLAGTLLFYGAADVTDDAQDGDLAADAWGEPAWIRGVNVGCALWFASLAAFLAAAEPEARGAMALAVSQAGLRMTAGQHLDFELVPGGRAAGEADYLACIEGKSGGSLGLFCRAAGIAAGRPAPDLELLEEVGRWVGAAVQVRSDVAEIWSATPSRDLANRRRTLPILYAEATLDPPGLAHLAELVGDPVRKPELIGLLDSIGAGGYCDLRLEGYSRRAVAALARLDLPAEAHVGLQEMVTDLVQPHWRVPV